MTTDDDGRLPSSRDYADNEAETFDRILAAVDRRHDTMDQLNAGVAELVIEVQQLRRAVEVRPTRHEVNFRRRKFAAWSIICAALLAGLIDQHTEVCGPGARVEAALRQFGAGETDPAILRNGIHSINPLCDVMSPWHSHRVGHDWPNDANDLGFALGAFGLVGLGAWTFKRRRADEEPPLQPAHQP